MRPALVMALVLALPAGGARAQGTADLYAARTIVTGTDMRARPDGLARCLRDVLVKLSGNPALRDDPRFDAAAREAPGHVQDLLYLDRMTDSPLHDEQGTRDRPYDLVAHFDPAWVDGVLAGAGEKPWPAPRPVLAVRVRLRQGAYDAPLSADGVADERQRRALLDAAERFGLRVALPTAAEADAPPGSGTVPLSGTLLSGTLRWSEADFGWVGDWQMAWQGAPHRWGVRGVSFDAAFRDAVGGAARVLSGHGG